MSKKRERERERRGPRQELSRFIRASTRTYRLVRLHCQPRVTPRIRVSDFFPPPSLSHEGGLFLLTSRDGPRP